MKRISLLKIMALGVLALAQTACENANNDVIDNLVYINEASTAKTKELTLLDGTTRTSLTVRLANVANQTIKATLFIDESLLEAYNKKNETNYKMPSKENILFPESVTIEAGSVSADPINVDIESFEAEGGAQYAVPISIKSVEGGIAKAEASSSFLLVLVKPLKQAVPKFTWYNAMHAAPSETWGIALPNYTLEWWSKVTAKSGTGGYTCNNQAIINSGGSGTELYIRFGDLIYSDGSSYKNNFLQVKTMGSQFDTGDPTKGKGLEAQKWYHFAVSYDASSGTTLLYQNGSVIASLSSSIGQPMNVDQFQMISSGQEYFPDFCEMCQVRFWKVTRTVNQIKKSMYTEVDYTDKNLLLYLPMNEGAGATVLRDVTGNGYDVEIGNSSTDTNRQNVTWETYSFAQ